jgi:PAS domain-containing protein
VKRDLREKIRAATEESGVTRPDFVALLELINEHYDKMEATITESLQTQTPLEAIFDSITDALLTVGHDGRIRSCNKVCTRYFG